MPARSPRPLSRRRTSLPPALVPLALVAIGVPAAFRAMLGRPRGMVAAWVLSFAAALVAQAIGEIAGWRTGTLGEAQVLLAALGAGLASVAVALREEFRE